MSDTSGRSSQTPFASFAPDSSCSRTWQVMSLWGWTSFSETWPRSGMTRGGDAYELPTLVLPTDGLEFSSLLPTPTTAPTTGNGHARNLGGEIRLMPTPVVNDMGAGKTVERWDEWTAEVKAKHNNGNGHGPSLSIEMLRLLPTPEAADGTGGRVSSELGGTRPSGAKRSVTIATAVAHLLPTPRTSDTNGAGLHGTGGMDLRTAVTLLPTPVTTDANGARNSTAGRQQGSKHHTGTTLTDAVTLLPTPMARDWKGHGPADADRHSPNLSAVPLLLPTPRAADGTKGGPNQRDSSGDLMLPSAVQMFSGESTSPPSDDRSGRLYDLHPGQLSMDNLSE